MLNNIFETIFLDFLDIHYLARKITGKITKKRKKTMSFSVAKPKIVNFTLQIMLKYMKSHKKHEKNHF